MVFAAGGAISLAAITGGTASAFCGAACVTISGPGKAGWGFTLVLLFATPSLLGARFASGADTWFSDVAGLVAGTASSAPISGGSLELAFCVSSPRTMI